MVGINNITRINITGIEQMGNFTDPMGFFINVDQTIYGGLLYFILLLLLWAILFFALQDKEDDFLRNAMVSGAIPALLSFFLRAISVIRNGIVTGMLNDFHMWIFPMGVALIATILVAKKKIYT